MSKSQKNLGKLVNLVEAALNSKAKAKSSDVLGNVVYIDTSVYVRETLEAFVQLSVSQFNQIPYFTFFTLEDQKFVDLFTEVLVEGAVIYALASQALLEKGREFKIEDKGIYLDPPNISEMLNTQYQVLLTHHFEKLKLIKGEIQSFKVKK
jgi:hypothetical protein